MLLRKFIRSGKNDDLVRKVELVQANPMYALVRFPDGRESNVSLRDLARCPRNGQLVDDGVRLADDGVSIEKFQSSRIPENEEQRGGGGVDMHDASLGDDRHDGSGTTNESAQPRRSSRQNKGIPPQRFGYS